MHTFSCALQSVDVDGTPVRFDADPGDYSNCRLYIGDNVLTFHRNGVLLSVAKVEPPPAADEPVDEPESGQIQGLTQQDTGSQAQYGDGTQQQAARGTT